MHTYFGVCGVQTYQVGALELGGLSPLPRQAMLASLPAEHQDQRTLQVCPQPDIGSLLDNTADAMVLLKCHPSLGNIGQSSAEQSYTAIEVSVLTE